MAMPARAGAARRIDHVEDAALAGDDGRQALGESLAGGAGAADVVARRAVEQFEFARHRVGRIDGFDRAGIGGIGEDQMAVGVARPDRRRQRFEQRLQGLDVAGQFVVAGGEIDELALDAADVAQAQHRAAADRAAFRLERTSGARWSAS